MGKDYRVTIRIKRAYEMSCECPGTGDIDITFNVDKATAQQLMDIIKENVPVVVE